MLDSCKPELRNDVLEGAVSPSAFVTTHWSVVVAAGDVSSPHGQAALENLCRSYWQPLYAYLLRQGRTPHDAQDLTQEFFAHFLEKSYFRVADRARGRFRSFLLTALKHFVAHEWEKARAVKRGGRQSFISWEEQPEETRPSLASGADLSPERFYDQQWALTLLEQALDRLGQESAANRKEQQFERLKAFLSNEPGEGAYAAVAAELGTSPGSVAVAVHRLRQRYGELVREEVANTVAKPEQVEDELRYLIELIG